MANTVNVPTVLIVGLVMFGIATAFLTAALSTIIFQERRLHKLITDALHKLIDIQNQRIEQLKQDWNRNDYLGITDRD